MKVRISFYNGETLYTYTDDTYEEGEIEFGEWEAPFPNEPGNSTAFGLCECLAQSDNCPSSFYKKAPTFVSVIKAI